MRRILISTTALSVAMSPMGTLPMYAQVLNEDGSVTGQDGTVLCIPTADVSCDLDAIIEALNLAEAAAEAEAAALAAAEATALAEAEAAAAAAAQAEAEAAAEAAALAAALAEEAARAEAEVAAQAAADAAAEAAAEAAAQAQMEAEAAAQAALEAQLNAEAEAAAQAVAEAEAAQAQAAADAQIEAEAEAAVQAALEAQLQADADAAAQADADAQADAAAQADVDAAVQAEIDAVAARIAAELEAAEAAAQAEVDAEAQTDAQSEDPAEALAEEIPAEEVPAEEAVAEEAVAEEAVPEALTEALVDGIINSATGEMIDPAVAAAALAAAEAELKLSPSGELLDPAAGLRVAEAEPIDPEDAVEAPVVTEAEVESLTELLTGDPTAIDGEALAAAASIAATSPEGEEAGAFMTLPTDAASLISAVTETITEDSSRSSAQEFSAAPVALAAGKKSGLSDLEKAGLLVLGALAVGAIIKSANNEREDRRVVSNTGDRVVVLRPDGTYQVLKDDDTVIRRPGSTVRTETFKDGSTRTIVERQDGTQVVTIRDATGRVLRRATYDSLGRELILIDDLAREEVVVVRDLPRPQRRIVISSKDSDAVLKRELAAIEAERAGRKFSLRQIREIPEVRALAAVIDTQNVTFASGSSAIAASEARNLADLGRVMQALLRANPGEVFLVEGHTDATGAAAMNLALSDRRAESVALALTEYFNIPPENMVVQGYGENELLIDTQLNEPRNRRVEVRVITPLLRSAQLR